MENLESQQLLKQDLKDMKKAFNLYLDENIRKRMKIKEAETGIKYQEKIRKFIKEDLDNEK